jgi:hypothetical protein
MRCETGGLVVLGVGRALCLCCLYKSRGGMEVGVLMLRLSLRCEFCVVGVAAPNVA